MSDYKFDHRKMARLCDVLANINRYPVIEWDTSTAEPFITYTEGDEIFANTDELCLYLVKIKEYMQPSDDDSFILRNEESFPDEDRHGEDNNMQAMPDDLQCEHEGCKQDAT